MVNNSYIVKFVMQIKVTSGAKSFFLSSSPGTKKTHLQMEIYVLLLDRKGEGSEIISFSSKESLCPSGIFGGGIFWSPSNIIAASRRLQSSKAETH